VSDILQRHAVAAFWRAARTADEHAVVLLHGFDGDETSLSVIADLVPDRVPVVALRGPLSTVLGGRAWAPASIPGRPDPSEVRTSTAEIVAWLRSSGLRRVVVVGHSQGGLMATEVARHARDLVAGVVIVAGFVLDDSAPDDERLAADRDLPVLDLRGDADHVIVDDAVAAGERWLDAHTAVEHRRSDADHEVSPQQAREAAEAAVAMLEPVA
jgi:phospholipase/carboxylesterase